MEGLNQEYLKAECVVQDKNYNGNIYPLEWLKFLKPTIPSVAIG